MKWMLPPRPTPAPKSTASARHQRQQSAWRRREPGRTVQGVNIAEHQQRTRCRIVRKARGGGVEDEGSADPGASVSHVDVPSGCFDAGMAGVADENGVVDVREAALTPGNNVVSLREVRWHGAAGDDTATITGR